MVNLRVFLLKAWVLRTSSFRRRDIGALPHFSWPCTQWNQWRFGCIFSCSYLLETALWNAWWAPVVFSITKVNILFSVELIFAFDVLGFLQGCKLWLRSTLSPSVMRNTLLGQCFHTRNEKSHKDIFDLFQPFLQACLWTIISLYL